MAAQESLKTQVARFAVQTLGFDDCRFTGPNLSETDIAQLQLWLASGHQGDMDYLRKHLPFKSSPDLLLPGVRTAIILIKNYNNTEKRRLTNRLKIARYAAGADYHRVIGKKLSAFARYLSGEVPGARGYTSIDARPVAERALAVKAGIGFRGKNTLVIQPGLGSYFFIAAVLTTIPFDPDQPNTTDCGECTLCLDSCPTGALSAEEGLDARKCISYQTVERKMPLSPEESDRVEGWAFGCDICQEVCPYNHGKIPLTTWPEFRPEAGVGFDFFDRENPESVKIKRRTSLYRSRKRIFSNWKLLKEKNGKRDA